MKNFKAVLNFGVAQNKEARALYLATDPTFVVTMYQRSLLVQEEPATKQGESGDYIAVPRGEGEKEILDVLAKEIYTMLDENDFKWDEKQWAKHFFCAFSEVDEGLNYFNYLNTQFAFILNKANFPSDLVRKALQQFSSLGCLEKAYKRSRVNKFYKLKPKAGEGGGDGDAGEEEEAQLSKKRKTVDSFFHAAAQLYGE